MIVCLEQCDGNIQIDLETPQLTSELKEKCPVCQEPECYFSCDGSCSDLEDVPHETEEQVASRRDWNCFVDGVESFLLALASAGYDVSDPKFQECVQTALDAGANYFSE